MLLKPMAPTYRLVTLKTVRSQHSIIGSPHVRRSLRRVLMRRLVEEDAVHGHTGRIRGPS